IDRMVRDVITSTLGCDYEAIAMSDEVLEALEELRRFMFEHMYLIPAVRDELEKAKRVITALFEHVVANPEDFLPLDSEETTERLGGGAVARGTRSGART